jgi:hypothetical protein
MSRPKIKVSWVFKIEQMFYQQMALLFYPSSQRPAGANPGKYINGVTAPSVTVSLYIYQHTYFVGLP